MKKRLTSLLLTAAMIISMVVIPTAAADTMGLAIGSAEGMPGETIEVNVDISGVSETPLGTLQFTVSYDTDSLELVGAPVGGSAAPAGAMIAGGDKGKTGTVNVSVITMMDPLSADGTLATISFKIKESVSANELALTAGLVVARTPASDGMTDVKSNFTLSDGNIDVIFPVSVSNAGGEQNTVTTATLKGAFTKNVASANVTEVGFVYDTDKNGSYASSIKADSVSEEFSAVLTISEENVGQTYYFKAYAVADGVTYIVDGPDAVDMFGPTATSVEVIDVPGKIDVTKETIVTTAGSTAQVYDQFGETFSYNPTKLSFKLDGEYKGVTIDAATGNLTVTNQAEDCTVTILAVYDGIVSAEGKTVVIDRPETSVEIVTISTEDSTAVTRPALTESAVAIDFDVYVEDNLGGVISDPVVAWDVTDAAGVSMDDNILYISTETTVPSVEVTATVDGVTSAPITVTITKDALVVTTVEMPEDATMTIPTDDSTKTETFTAKVYDQYGDVMDKAVTYTFATADSYVTASGNTVSVVKGAEKNKTYTLTAECDGKSDFMTIKVVDIDIVWGATSIAANPTYGMTWGQIVSVANGTATLEGSNVPGTWTVANANEIPNAGTQTFTVVFQSNDGKYTVTSAPDSVEIAQKEITATWAGYTGLVYSGNAVNVTASVPVEGVNVIVTNGDAINAGDYTATAEPDNANYKLSAASASQAYTIAKANIPTLDNADAQQISVNKANKANVLALIADEIKAYDFNGTALAGTIDLTTEIKAIVGNYTIFGTFTPDSTNFNAYTFQFALEVTEGDPQTLTFAQESVTATYGDAPVANVATITVGGTGAITYASNNTDVATVDENTGVVTFVKPGSATITATAAAEGDWAASSKSYDVKVNPKAVTITGATAADKPYDGNTDAVISSTEYTISGAVAGDDVTVDAINAKAVFANANVGVQTVTFSGFALTGEDAANYELSAQPADTTAEITKITDVTVKLTNTNQAPGESVTPVGVETTPAVDPSKITVYYEIVDTPAVKAGDVLTPCGHAEDKTSCTADEGAECDHTDGCGYTVAETDVPAIYKWVTEVPTAAGTYPVKVVIEGDPNVADQTITGDDMKLVLEASSGGGGGGITYAATVTKPENGSITVSPKYALKGSTVTIKVQPDEGYELGELVVVDKNGNEIELTEKNGKYTFEMPASKVEISAEFVKADDTCASDKFSDLDTEAWYHDAVDYVIENGMMAGVSADEFAPGMNLTRGMVVQILWAMEGKPVVNYAMTFEDVASDAWYAEAVRWAASEGVIAGYSVETFGPADSVTREQMAVMLAGYARYKGVDVTKNVIDLNFVDADSASDWAVVGLKWACGEGILSGKSGNKLDPTGTATRMEAAQMLMKFDAVLAD